MQDLYNNVVVERAISPVVVNAGDATGQIHDMQGYDAIMFVIASGTVTAGDATPIIHVGDESNLSDAAAAPDADLLPQGTGQEAARIFEDADDDAVVTMGYRGKKRYVRLSLTDAGSVNALMVAIALKGKAARVPVS